jgi:catechol 2,3-dioxygenase-like lactoylglutathione lyase family enzyme
MILGINHLTLAVSNLEQSFQFYTQTVGLRPVARWYKGAYLLAGDDWICLALDPSRNEGPLPEYTHIALTVAQHNFERIADNLRLRGVKSWQENHSPGPSFYFLDPDGHKLEIHTGSLTERLQHLRANPPKELTIFA